VEDLVATLGEHAPGLVGLALGDLDLAADVLHRPLERADTTESLRETFLSACDDLDDGPELLRTLRRLRHRAVVRIALREVLRLADVDQTSREMAALASACTEAALRACMRSAVARRGEPRDPEGNPVPLVALGMGKLGGGELNLGSDVDLCFFYGTDEGTVGDGDTSIHELYTRVVSRTVQALSELTEDGFCFRVDLRLRPEGSRGPLVNSLASAERYYEAWGRTWERAALLRAHPIAGDHAFGQQLLETLAPFVFRRSVDPSIAREMGEMLRRTRREQRVDGDRDVKLGRGGIREAEFFVQTLQLVWGGKHPELRVRGTMEALHRLRAAGLVTHREAEDFETAWAMLRRVEHRIHMRAGYQTHALPPPGPDRDALASSLGFPDSERLWRKLAEAREGVASLFRSLDEGSEPEASPELEALCDQIAAGASPSDLVDEVATTLPVHDADEAASHLVRLGRMATGPLGADTRRRRPRLGGMLLQEVSGAADPDLALRFMADFFTRLGRPGGYLQLFDEHPRLLRRLISLFGASGTLSSALVGHPEAVDQLLVATGAPSPEEIGRTHREAPLDFDPSAPEQRPDPESFVAALRQTKRELTLQVGLAHVSGEIALGEVQTRLTALAEAQIDAALRYAQAEVFARFGTPQPPSTQGQADTSPPGAEEPAHTDPPGTAGPVAPATMIVIGMGKLGARELGFGGDLDLMFLYGADGPGQPANPDRPVTNAELFTRIAQRTMRLLSQPDAEGSGYETDTRLRPSGSQGMLVVSLASFDRYHDSRAEPWERQALVRARPVAGDPQLAEMVQTRFERLVYGMDAPAPQDVAAMRTRIERELAGERHDRYDPKFGYGGLLDVEFAIQWLQMRHGSKLPGPTALRSPGTLEALQGLRHAGHLERGDAEALEEGYLLFRNVEQAVRLLDESREVVVIEGGRIAEQVARRLGIRERDGKPPTEVLFATWRRQASEVRALFERLLGPVSIPPPWSEDGTP
jgi:glutamate-ammonia-ligase adenylyltransferase